MIMHVYIGSKSGVMVNYKKQSPIRTRGVKLFERVRYLGTTEDMGWPKKLSSGRILHKPDSNIIKKNGKYRKEYKKLLQVPNN